MPRVIMLPMSGRDRQHYVRELKAAEKAHVSQILAVKAAYAVAHRAACEEWNTRQFIGGGAAPSPIISDAIEGGCELLDVQCTRCGHCETVELTQIVWPRENQVHTLERALRCQRCKRQGGPKARTNLVALRVRETPSPTAARRRARDR